MMSRWQQQQGFSIEELRAGETTSEEEEEEEEEDEEANKQDFYDASMDESDEIWLKNELGVDTAANKVSLVCACCFTSLAFQCKMDSNGLWNSVKIINCSLEEEEIRCTECDNVVGKINGYANHTPIIAFTSVIPSSSTFNDDM